MSVPKTKSLEVWSLRLTLATACIVLGLSWLNGVRGLGLLLRGGISFGVMYFLSTGMRHLFEMTAPREAPKRSDATESGRGILLDVAVEADEALTLEAVGRSEMTGGKFPGQVDRELTAGLPDSERQAEIVRRMGWSDGNE